jgi:glycosyltransferase involved in cell wall biosynthesis/1-acyl-sn-glycerol-3-phosphate acyltransferase
MVITFVIDFFTPINGTSMTAIRFREELLKRGHTVRVVSVGIEGNDMYPLKEHYVPIASNITRKQSMIFAKPDVKILEKAFQGADIVHFFLPYKLAMVGQKIADKMGIPHIAAFHCQPENVTYSMGLGWFEGFASFIYKRFNKKVYSNFQHIHCPSKFIANELKKYNYKAKLHIFSNGVSDIFTPSPVDYNKKKDFFNILMIGRLVSEKRQDVLIKAINHSKYKDKIKLTLAGNGPKKNHYQRLGRYLPNPPTFGFYSSEELLKIIHNTDLYVHPADIEIEAIACLEVLSCAKVPIISDSRKSATKQFALDDRSLFKSGDHIDLARKIDYWIEHEEERLKMEKLYCESVKQYKLKNIIVKTEELYAEAIQEYKKTHPALFGLNQVNKPYVPKINFIPPAKEDAHINEIKRVVNITFDKNYPYIDKSLKFKILSILVHITIHLIVFPMMWFMFRLKIKGKDKIKKLRKKYKGGVITVSNHVHNWDYLCVLKAVSPRRLYCPVLKENIESKDRHLMRLCNLIPIPDTSLHGMSVFIKTINSLLGKGKFVHFYPEASLWPLYQPIRPFKSGGFNFAVKNKVPVLPMAISYRQGKKNKVYFTLTIGDPIFPDLNLPEEAAIVKITEESRMAVMKCAGIELPVNEKYN